MTMTPAQLVILGAYLQAQPDLASQPMTSDGDFEIAPVRLQPVGVHLRVAGRFDALAEEPRDLVGVGFAQERLLGCSLLGCWFQNPF